MHVRSYRPDDLEALFTLDRLCFAPAFRFSRKMMRSCAEQPGAITRLVMGPEPGETAERLQGFVIVQLEENQRRRIGYIVTLDVDPGTRRRGIGRMLLAHVEQEAATAGAEAISLHVYTANEPAVRLYEAFGYRKLQTERAFYGRGLDAFVYGKAFTPARPDDAEYPASADSIAPRLTDAS